MNKAQRKNRKERIYFFNLLDMRSVFHRETKILSDYALDFKMFWLCVFSST